MLADFVLAHKEELTKQVELRAAADEGRGPAEGRHRRVTGLVEELIEALQHRGGSPAPGTETGRRGALLSHERSIIRDETVAEIVRRSLAVPPSEMVILCRWASAPNQRRLEERARRLSDLLDDVQDAAVIVTPDGRTEYLNRLAAQFLHEATGVPMDSSSGRRGASLASLKRSTSAAIRKSSETSRVKGRPGKSPCWAGGTGPITGP
jgi:PAS domain-containing protein